MGDTIILDNGAYEGKQSTEEELISAIEFYGPQITVLPDKFLQPWGRTYEATYKFLDRYVDHFRGMKWMYVPQAERNDIMGWIDGLLHALDDFPIYAIGIPRCLVTDISPDPLMRVRAVEFIKRRWKEVYTHALGMYRGNVEELKLLSMVGCDSIDSSAPVWRGWCGYSLDIPSDIKRWDEIGTECDFQTVNAFADARHPFIMKNLEACGVNIHQTR